MTFLSSLLTATLILTPIILVLLLFAPLMDKKYSAVGRYWMWLLIIISLYAPFATFIPRPMLQIDIPVSEIFISRSQIPNESNRVEQLESQDGSEIYLQKNFNKLTDDSAPEIMDTPDMPVIPDTTGIPADRSFTIPDLSSILLFIWLVGIFGSLTYQATVHLLFRRYVRRWSVQVTKNDMLAVFNEECARLSVRAGIGLRFCKGINTPMLAGVVKPMLLLPDSYYDAKDLTLIFRHELTHYKRHDLWYKLALVVTRSMYWFNPAVYLMEAQANKDIETVCDAQTVSGMDMSLRKRYSEILLSMAAGPCAYRSQLTTCFTGGKNVLKQRFANILGTAKKKGAAMFIVLGVAIFAAGLMVGFNLAPASPAISKAESIPVVLPDNGSADTILKTAASSNEELAKELSDEIDAVINKALEESDLKFTKSFSVTASVAVYDNLDKLKALVYNEAKVTERVFDNISALEISTAGDGVRITRGGDKLSVRYYEWLENECTLNVKDGKLTLSQNNIPFYKIGDTTTNGWLNDYLKSQGKQLNYTIEIIIPASMQLDVITIDTASGQVNVQDCRIIRNLNIDTASGQVDVTGCRTGGDMVIDTASGRVSVKDCVIDGNMVADTASGRVSMVNCSISGNTTADTASGQVDVESCMFGNIEISTTSGNGNIKLTGSAKDYDISFDSLSGKLTYNGERVNNMRNSNAASGIKLSSVSGSFSVSDAK